MARQRTQNAISLFPFLAVLVCTMGALILLLLVTTRRIRNDQMVVANVVASETNDNAIEPVLSGEESSTADELGSSEPDIVDVDSDDKVRSSDSTPRLSLQVPDKSPFAEVNSNQAQKPVVPTTLFDLRSNVDRLQAELDQETARHEDLLKQIELTRQQVLAADTIEQSGVEMQKLASLRREEAELDNELKRRAEELGQLQDDLELASKSTEDGEQVLRQRESALISLRQLAKEAEPGEIAGTDKTVVEFTNGTGTQRVPIIVDVTGDGYEFLPSGIRLTKTDMEGFPGNDNPLLSGVMAVYQHRFPNAISARPYVLLLVRPDGSLPFYTAQRVLTESNVHFGYELLEQDRIIDAGRKSAAEAQAARASILAAIDRRSRLYGGLLAEVREMLQQHEDAQLPGSRQARVLPDGRIVMAGEDADGYDGKFYAGGIPKPTSSPGSRNQSSPPSRSPFDTQPTDSDRAIGRSEGHSNNGGALRADDGAQAVADWMKLLEKNQTRQPPSELAATGDSFSKSQSLVNGENPFAAANSESPSEHTSQTAESLAAAPTTNGTQPLTLNNLPPNEVWPNGDVNEKGFAESATDQSLPKGNLRSQMSAMLGRSEAISGNLGIGGIVPTDNQFPFAVNLENPTATDSAFADPIVSTIKNSGPANDASHQPSWLEPPNAASNPASNNPAIDNSHAAFGWPGSDAATSEQATRTADVAENSSNVNFADESAATASAAPSAEVDRAGKTRSSTANEVSTITPTEPGGSSLGFGTPIGENQGGPKRGNVPVSDAQMMLQKFLHEAEREKEIQQANSPQPDPFLLSLLTQSRQTHQANLSGRYPVTVSLDQNQLTIGRYEAIDVSGYDDQQILAITLEGLAAEMDQQKPENAPFALPMVDFRIGRDAWQRQNQLARQLNEMNVPTRSVQNWFDPTNSNSSVDSASAAPEQTRLQGTFTAPMAEPAEPIEINAPSRRNSI